MKKPDHLDEGNSETPAILHSSKIDRKTAEKIEKYVANVDSKLVPADSFLPQLAELKIFPPAANDTSS